MDEKLFEEAHLYAMYINDLTPEKRDRMDTLFRTLYPKLLARANDGDGWAQYAVGYCLYFMKTPIDRESATSWFRRSADQGCSHGLMAMGWVLYEQQLDSDLAMDYYTRAAEAGNSYALLYMGVQNWDENREFLDCWVKSANLGNPVAACRLGYHYSRKMDNKRAIEWYSKAYEYGSIHAPVRIGELVDTKLEKVDWCIRGYAMGNMYGLRLFIQPEFRPALLYHIQNNHPLLKELVFECDAFEAEDIARALETNYTITKWHILRRMFFLETIERIVSLLQSNTSLTDVEFSCGTPSVSAYVNRNMDALELCRSSALCVVWCNCFGRDLSLLIAKEIWKTRGQREWIRK